MTLYPLFLTRQFRHYYFGKELIKQKITADVPAGLLAETWECSDYGAVSAQITNGLYQGKLLRELVIDHPEALLGVGMHAPHFPLLAKFLDASYFLPVHLHANDRIAQQKYGLPNGKTEAWHILWAKEGATILAGMKSGVTEEQARQAFRNCDYTAVVHEYPIKTGDTVYIPGGVIHSFGPDALVYEIQQTSDLGQNVMPTDLFGNRYSEKAWHSNIEAVLEELEWAPQPQPTQGLSITNDQVTRTILAAGAYFALERWTLSDTSTRYSFDRAQILTNLGNPLTIAIDQHHYVVHAGQTCLLPAGLKYVDLQCDRQGDFLLSYIPDIPRQIISPLQQAGFSSAQIQALGDFTIRG